MLSNEKVEKILEDDGWTIECQSPLEIRHEHGSFATMLAAQYLVQALVEEAETKEESIARIKSELAMTMFDKSDWGSLHDTILEVTGYSLTDEGLEGVYEQLPDNIKDDALHWGLGDSVVRDNIYTYLKNNEFVVKEEA